MLQEALMDHCGGCWTLYERQPMLLLGLVVHPRQGCVPWGPETCQARLTGLEERHMIYAVLESPSLAGCCPGRRGMPALPRPSAGVASRTIRLVFLKQTLA